MSKASALHILKRHTNIDCFSILRLPVVIMKAEFYRESKKRNHVYAIHRDEDGCYMVVIKETALGHEVWVSSMYKLDDRSYRRKIRQGEKL